MRAPEEEPEVCEVALVSYSLSILVALAFLTVDAVSGRSHSSRLDVRRLMLASDIVSSIVATLFVAGSLVYYLYGFIESLQSIHDLTNQEIPGEETAAASLIIVFSVASLLSWVSSIHACQWGVFRCGVSVCLSVCLSVNQYIFCTEKAKA